MSVSISKVNSLPTNVASLSPGSRCILPNGKEYILNNSKQWIPLHMLALEMKDDLTTENLNSVTSYGIYLQNQNLNATVERNYPSPGSAGILKVFTNGNDVYQEFQVLSGQVNENKTYTRGLYGGVWSSWLVPNFVNFTQAEWNTVKTNSHTHSNKANLDSINQDLNRSSSVIFDKLFVNNSLIFGANAFKFYNSTYNSADPLTIGNAFSSNLPQVVFTGGLVASDNYVYDGQYLPLNGIYSKGVIKTENNLSSEEWKQAYNWGNHATAGYLNLTQADAKYVKLNNNGEIQTIDSGELIITDTFNQNTSYFVPGSTFSKVAYNELSVNRFGFHSRYINGSSAKTFIGISSFNMFTETTTETKFIEYDSVTDKLTFASHNSIYFEPLNLGTTGATKILTLDSTGKLGYINGTPLMSFTETDPTVPSHVKAITQTNLNSWNSVAQNYLGYVDDRNISPNDLGTQKIQFGFTSFTNNNTGPWADFIHFGGYQDSSGENQNLIVFNKNGFGLRQFQGTFQSDTSYNNYVDYWHSGNFNPNDYAPKNNPVFNNKITIRDDAIEDNGTNGLSAIVINYAGYNAGYTHYRNLDIYDGKGGHIAQFNGQNKELNVFGKLTANSLVKNGGTSTQILMADGSVVEKSTIASQTLSTSIDNNGRYLSISGGNQISIDSRLIHVLDSPNRSPNDPIFYPNVTGKSVRFDFISASHVAGTGNYAGVMTFSPWDGTTNSTGDSSYQLAFYNQTGVNGTGIPGLKIRKGIDTTWNSWYKIYTTGDFSQSNIDNWNTAFGWGNHATQGYLKSSDSSNYVTTNTLQTITGLKEFQASGNTYYQTSLQVKGNGTTILPGIGFHQPGVIGNQLNMANDGWFQFTNHDSSDYANIRVKNITSNGMILFNNNVGGVYGVMGDNDAYRICGRAASSNQGYLEISTADDGNEPIIVSQYFGEFSNLARRAYLLDESGNTSFPGTVTAPTFSGNLNGNAATATNSTNALKITFNDGPRNLSDRLPNSFARTVNFDFVTAGTVGGAGNYAGVMTFSPWDGTTNSTGDSSYQLAFLNETGINGSGIPGLALRKGIDSTWGSWYNIAHSGNLSITYSGNTLSLLVKGNVISTATINAGANYTAGTNISISSNQISVVASPTFSGSVTASSFFETSLRKYKTNIKKFDKSGIDLVDSLEIVTFDRIDSDVKSKIGIIADDTSDEFLSEQKDAIDLYKTIFIQSKAIQELNAKNLELEARLIKLEKLLSNG